VYENTPEEELAAGLLTPEKARVRSFPCSLFIIVAGICFSQWARPFF
jgi:hypothetical protein